MLARIILHSLEQIEFIIEIICLLFIIDNYNWLDKAKVVYY